MQQDDRWSWFLKKTNFLKKTGGIYIIGPPKGSFGGCSGSRSCAAQRQTCIGGDAWVSRGSIAHAYRHWYLPICGRKCDGAREKRKTGQNEKTALENAEKFEKSTKRCGIVFFEVRAFQRYLENAENSKNQQSDAESFSLRSGLSNDIGSIWSGLE